MPTDAQRRNLASAHHAEVQALTERIAVLESERDAIAELNHAQWLALENVRLLSSRHRTEDWAQHMLRFVSDAGTNKARITRAQVDAAITRTQEQT